VGFSGVAISTEFESKSDCEVEAVLDSASEADDKAGEGFGLALVFVMDGRTGVEILFDSSSLSLESRSLLLSITIYFVLSRIC
jgi:hypothetical protein